MRRLAAALALLIIIAAGCGGGGDEEGGTYIALGDSISAGRGASDAGTTSFVPLVYKGLGDGWELLNFSRSGDTSADLLKNGNLQKGVDEIESRSSDDGSDNDVRLVTLEIGGNDLLQLNQSLVLGGRCPSAQAAVSKPECYEAANRALTEYEVNLKKTVADLKAADDATPIIIMTLYNPFAGSIPFIAEIGEIVLEGKADSTIERGMNDIIREQATASGLNLVDLYALFRENGSGLVAGDFIHPSDKGHKLIADAVLEAFERLR